MLIEAASSSAVWMSFGRMTFPRCSSTSLVLTWMVYLTLQSCKLTPYHVRLSHRCCSNRDLQLDPIATDFIPSMSRLPLVCSCIRSLLLFPAYASKLKALELLMHHPWLLHPHQHPLPSKELRRSSHLSFVHQSMSFFSNRQVSLGVYQLEMRISLIDSVIVISGIETN